jgi:bacterioferritin (cytochrome b1)
MLEKIIIPREAQIHVGLYYKEIMSFMYQVIVASEPLLELSVKKSDGKLKEYLKAHLEEERGHQEWLKEDLKEIGIDVDSVQYNEVASEMAGSQYYILNHCEPYLYLGYMLFLEGFPTKQSVVKQLELLYGEKAVRTLKYHSEHDVNHAKELLDVIDTYSDKEKEDILMVAQQTANNYAKAMNKIVSEKKFCWQLTA